MTLADLSGPARATVKRVTAGAELETIDAQREHGRLRYEVSARFGAKRVEYTVADSDGRVLASEVGIEFAELPVAVRAAAAKYFDSLDGLAPSMAVAHGRADYDVIGARNGKPVVATFDAAGRQLH